MLEVARLQDRIPAVAELHRFIICTRRLGGTANEGGGWDQSIGSKVYVLREVNALDCWEGL